jgi:phthiocerol/phenolphthiocerol synthesis type-I polyketide synthase E
VNPERAVAIIGMACRFPGAPDVPAYWDLLRAGGDGIRRFSAEELASAGADPALTGRRDFVPARGIVDGSQHFDWSHFGYSRAEAATIDPQQRVFLECATAAIDDAGIDPSRCDGWIGVYAGSDYTVAPPDPDLDPLTLVIGRDKDFLATRVAYKLGLRGPAITVQTACSTSLTAVHTAVQSLLGHECDVALAGGVTIAAPWQRGYLFQEGGILSPDGRCRPFDEDSAGTVPSEGVGVVILKRLADAIADGDRIAAVIAASAVNNDGGDKIGYTAPSVAGQRDVIRLAQQLAEVEPAEIGYVEAHGTATRLGDPVEVQALADVFGGGGDRARTWLGSVKGNLGHTGAAAGVAGLIKTALMLKHAELVPTAGFQAPNPLLGLADTPFAVSDAVRPWPAERPHAGVSSFGVGGTNVHVVLGPAPAAARPPQRGGPELFALSATTPEALTRFGGALAAHLRRDPEARPADVAWTLAGRRRFDVRRAVVADGLEEAARLLEAESTNIHNGRPKVAFLFPGQGTLRHAAGAEMYRLLPAFAEAFDEIREQVLDLCGVDLTPVVAECRDPSWFTDTVHQQLGLLALGLAAGRTLLSTGLEPAGMIGNSIGEYVAAALSGVWTLRDAITIVHARATAMRDTPPGRMLAVAAPAERVRALLPDQVSIAVERPGAVVLSGAADAVAELRASGALAEFDVRDVDSVRAFHSPLMDSAVEPVRAAVAAADSRTARFGVVSNLTGDWALPDQFGDARYWSDHLRHPVRLEAGIDTLLASGCDLFVELGPGTSMIGSLRGHHAWSPDHTAVPLFGRQDDDGTTAVLRAMASLWSRGVDVPVAELTAGTARCSLPAHPLNSQPLDREVPQAPKPTRSAPVDDDGRTALARLWCAALGVATVTDHDDFFALGGESLMVVQLLNRVRRQTGGQASVAEFSVEPTFGRLVALADQTNPGSRRTPTGLVRLGGDEDGTPLFLVADVCGTTAGYRAVAAAAGRPVFGVEPLPGPTRGLSIEDIAAAGVEVLRAVDPEGPYLLGGWSFGAVVAHEMARQLGPAAVRHLLLIDGYLPPTLGRPARTDLPFWLSTLRLRLAVSTGRGPLGRLTAADRDTHTRVIANLRAVRRYRPRPLSVSASLFKANCDADRATSLADRLGVLYRGGVRVHPTDGDHWSMLQPPHAESLAAHLRAELELVDPAAGPAAPTRELSTL